METCQEVNYEASDKIISFPIMLEKGYVRGKF